MEFEFDEFDLVRVEWSRRIREHPHEIQIENIARRLDKMLLTIIRGNAAYSERMKKLEDLSEKVKELFQIPELKEVGEWLDEYRYDSIYSCYINMLRYLKTGLPPNPNHN